MDTILNVSKLCSGYGELPVLHDIDLHVKRGEIVAVVGANGAGKTTLLLTITGHLRAQSGQVLFDGQDVSAEPAHAAAARGLRGVWRVGRGVEERVSDGGRTRVVHRLASQTHLYLRQASPP
jgi:ABC-type branched-subunit amino acid transport system ATPase component